MRFSTGILAIILLVLPAVTVDAGLISKLTYVNGAGQDVQASFVHGFVQGNDASSGGEPLLTYLNSGTFDTVTGTYLAEAALPTLERDEIKQKNSRDPKPFHVTKNGLFSDPAGVTEINGIEVVNYVERRGNEAFFNPDTWNFAGKHDAETGAWEAGQGQTPEISLGPGASLNGAKSGTFDVVVSNGAQLDGAWVVSVKLSNQFAVYAFRGITGETTTFNFGTFEQGVSHISFYYAEDEEPTNNVLVPEPGSASVLLAFLLLSSVGFRGRKPSKAGLRVA